jgi:hypothetical protein
MEEECLQEDGDVTPPSLSPLLQVEMSMDDVQMNIGNNARCKMTTYFLKLLAVTCSVGSADCSLT